MGLRVVPDWFIVKVGAAKRALARYLLESLK